MKNTVAFYSPSNLDSCMAVSLLCIQENEASNPVKTIAYSRGTLDFNSPEAVDVIYVIGADLSVENFVELIEKNPNAKFEVSSYVNATQYSNKVLSSLVEGKRISFNNCFIEGHKVSLTTLQIVRMTQAEFCTQEELTHVNELSRVLSKFVDFEMLTNEETLQMFAATRMIKKLASSGSQYGDRSILDRSRFKPATTEEYADYVQDIRSMLSANMAMAYYAGANGSAFMTPTICISERDALQAMRFINYSYNEAISFEDTRFSRIYRILASESNLQWYIRRFEPSDIWSEGSLIYIKTELPRHVR